MSQETEGSVHRDLSSLDRAVAFRINRTSRLLRQHLILSLQKMGTDLTPEQFFLLFRLHERDGVTQAQLADPHLNDRSNITRLLDGLEKRELILRGANPEDRRSYHIFLTPTGREVIKQLLGQVTGVREEVFEGISEDELATLLSMLDRIDKNTSKYIKS